MQNNVLTWLHMNAIDVTYMYTDINREGQMQPVSEYTWSYISSKFFKMYSTKAVYSRPYDLKTYNRSCYAQNKSASWQNPPIAPPAPPARKFDTSINFGFNQWQINNAS
jgi:hypothetical protein